MSLKRRLHALCLTHIDERIKTINEAMSFTQGAANEETKSSAGDKYETGRAMAQLEIEKAQEQLAEAQKQRKALLQLDPGSSHDLVQPGSLVFTNQGNFYIAVAAGQFTIDGKIFFTVSPFAPLSQKLLGVKMGERFVFNKREFVVEKIS